MAYNYTLRFWSPCSASTTARFELFPANAAALLLLDAGAFFFTTTPFMSDLMSFFGALTGTRLAVVPLDFPAVI